MPAKVNAADGFLPPDEQRGAVVGVNGRRPAVAELVGFRDAGILRPLTAQVVATSVRQARPDELRDSFEQQAVPRFTGLRRRNGTLALVEHRGHDQGRHGDHAHVHLQQQQGGIHGRLGKGTGPLGRAEDRDPAHEKERRRRPVQAEAVRRPHQKGDGQISQRGRDLNDSRPGPEDDHGEQH